MKINPLYKNIIFDLDGTILDSERPAMTALAAAFNHYGYSVDNEILRQCIGIRRVETELLFKKHFPEAPLNAIIEYTRAEIRKSLADNGAPVKKGISELLDQLRKKQYRMAVATSTPVKYAEKRIKQKNLLHYFDVIVGGDMVENGKPAPDIFLLTAEKLGADPTSCVVFEDSGPGIKAAHSAGMRVIHIEDLAQPTDEILKLCFKQFPSALEVLQNLESIIE